MFLWSVNKNYRKVCHTLVYEDINDAWHRNLLFTFFLVTDETSIAKISLKKK